MDVLLAKTEVGELNVAFVVDEDVLGLEVAVYDHVGVHVADGVRDLGRVEAHARLRKRALMRQVVEELAAVHVVEHEVELVRRLERVVQADEERMAQIAYEHVALGHDVLDLVALDDRLLAQHLDRVDLVLELVNGHEHFAERAAADQVQKLKVGCLRTLIIYLALID